jgi:hypothetical protein
MVAEAFFHNPDFLRYVRLLAQLHLAMKEGWDETADGEALREEMDEPGSRLSRKESTSASGISADLHSLADDSPAQVLPMTENVMANLDAALQARKAKDFNKALELLREFAAYVPAPSLACAREGLVRSH